MNVKVSIPPGQPACVKGRHLITSNGKNRRVIELPELPRCKWAIYEYEQFPEHTYVHMVRLWPWSKTPLAPEFSAKYSPSENTSK